MRKSKAYKVVRVDNGIRRSAIVGSTTEQDVFNKYSIVYRANSLITPKVKNSKIFVFKSLRKARDFKNGNSNKEVWRVEAHNLKEGKLRCSLHLHKLDSFWKGNLNKDMQYSTPVNTHFCDSLVMVKKVD